MQAFGQTQAGINEIALAPAAVALELIDEIGRHFLVAAGQIISNPHSPAGTAHQRGFYEIMGENLTLFRGSSGTAYLIGNRCAHRGTQLSTGIVEGEGIRCAYHGWKYDGAGQCVDQPSEPCSFAERVRIKGYPTREYLGLVFAYMGQGEPPPMPRYPHFEADGAVVSHRLVWPFNYFQHLENAIDEVHIAMPNRHCLLVDLSPFGMDNPNEVFLPIDEPHGLIEATLSND